MIPILLIQLALSLSPLRQHVYFKQKHLSIPDALACSSPLPKRTVKQITLCPPCPETIGRLVTTDTTSKYGTAICEIGEHRALNAKAEVLPEISPISKSNCHLKDWIRPLWDILCNSNKLDPFQNYFPPRSSQCPYVAHAGFPRALCARGLAVTRRKDFLWITHDLSQHMTCNNSGAVALNGVTVAPSKNYTGPQYSVNPAKRRFLLTFVGSCKQALRKTGCTSITRIYMALHVLQFATRVKKKPKLNVIRTDKKKFLFPSINLTTCLRRKAGCIRLMCTHLLPHWGANYYGKTPFYNEHMNSVFVLVPRGDERWTYRFSEVIGAGAIPVVIADGLSLPYEEIIDWNKAAIVVPENMLHRLIEYLPTRAKQTKMLQEVRKINHRYFSTPHKRYAALYRCLAIRIGTNPLLPRPMKRLRANTGPASTLEAINDFGANPPFKIFPNNTFWISPKLKHMTDYITQDWINAQSSRLLDLT